MDFIGLLAHVRLLLALLGQSRRHLWEAQDLHLGLGLVRFDDAYQPLSPERDCL